MLKTKTKTELFWLKPLYNLLQAPAGLRSSSNDHILFGMLQPPFRATVQANPVPATIGPRLLRFAAVCFAIMSDSERDYNIESRFIFKCYIVVLHLLVRM